MFGWCSRAAAWTSRRKRSAAPGRARISGRITFSATSRPMTLCSASQTVPMPPHAQRPQQPVARVVEQFGRRFG